MSEFGSIREVVAAWQAKRLRESELITILTEWPYAPTNPVEPLYGADWEPGTNTFQDVVDENLQGTLPDHIYDAVLELIAAKEDHEQT